MELRRAPGCEQDHIETEPVPSRCSAERSNGFLGLRPSASLPGALTRYLPVLGPLPQPSVSPMLQATLAEQKHGNEPIASEPQRPIARLKEPVAQLVEQLTFNQ